jgi:hypothetical protein
MGRLNRVELHLKHDSVIWGYSGLPLPVVHTMLGAISNMIPVPIVSKIKLGRVFSITFPLPVLKREAS